MSIAILTACSSTAPKGDGQISEDPEGVPVHNVQVEAIWECRDFIYDEKVALVVGKTDITVGDVVSEEMDELLEAYDQSIEELKGEEEFSESLDKLNQFYVGFIRLVGEQREGAFYYRQGLDHRWEWADTYVFVIEPGGRGYYYDFTDADDGESVGASDSFKCERQ
jgi:hypothetical protein